MNITSFTFCSDPATGVLVDLLEAFFVHVDAGLDIRQHVQDHAGELPVGARHAAVLEGNA
jgi:hypothetical protein